MNIPSDLYYTETHEWVREAEDGKVVVGITDHAQAALGSVVFVDLPGVGDEVTAGESFGGVESVKAFSDVYAPVGGRVVAINEEIEDDPEIVNNEPYKGGWLIEIELEDAAELKSLFNAQSYEQHLNKK